MSELTKEILKSRREHPNSDSIKEELSHVLISLYVYADLCGIKQGDIEKEAMTKLKEYGWGSGHQEQESEDVKTGECDTVPYCVQLANRFGQPVYVDTLIEKELITAEELCNILMNQLSQSKSTVYISSDTELLPLTSVAINKVKVPKLLSNKRTSSTVVSLYHNRGYAKSHG